MARKFNYADKVSINGNVIGMVLSSYAVDEEQTFIIYRVAVNASELAYRSVNNTVDQTNDPLLLIEDWDTMIKDANTLLVLEIEETKLEILTHR